ncbi:hypothetical protein ACGWJW_002761 [Enterococcus hirae]
MTNTSSYYKVGWWKKGKQYRYCLGMGLDGLVYYRTKRQVLGKSRCITGRHPDFDKWFSKAEYIGLDLEETE